MTKTSLETPSDPLRMLDNKNIHEMICTFPTLLPKLAQELVRRFIKTTHIGHDERNKVAGYYTVTLGGLQGELAALLSDGVLHKLFQRKHFFLDEGADTNVDPRGRFFTSWIDEFIVRALTPSGHSDFLGREKAYCLRLVVDCISHGVVLDLLGCTRADKSVMAAAIRRPPAVLVLEVDDAARDCSGNVCPQAITHFEWRDQGDAEKDRP